MTPERSLYEDPTFYDRLTSQPGGSLDFYLNVVRASAGAVLELACGTGRLTIVGRWLGVAIKGVGRRCRRDAGGALRCRR